MGSGGFGARVQIQSLSTVGKRGSGELQERQYWPKRSVRGEGGGACPPREQRETWAWLSWASLTVLHVYVASSGPVCAVCTELGHCPATFPVLYPQLGKAQGSTASPPFIPERQGPGSRRDVEPASAVFTWTCQALSVGSLLSTDLALGSLPLLVLPRQLCRCGKASGVVWSLLAPSVDGYPL